MGLQLPKRAQRLALGTMLGLTLLMLGACSAEDKAQAERWAMPANSPGTTQAEHIADLWKWSWIVLLAVGALVWGLMFYVAARYRRRSADEVPVQTRYNLPLEVLYTIAPVFMVIAFFYWTVTVQDKVLEHVDNPDRMVEVTAQQWQWTFNHSDGDAEAGGPVVYEAGTASYIPELVLPVDETIEFKLASPDVIHSFWIPGFLMKMDVIPGQAGEDRNSFQVHTTKLGHFRGKCAELCGTYHSRMIFDVKVVTSEEYEAYLAEKKAQGLVANEPLLGGEHAATGSESFNLDKNDGGEE